MCRYHFWTGKKMYDDSKSSYQSSMNCRHGLYHLSVLKEINTWIIYTHNVFGKSQVLFLIWPQASTSSQEISRTATWRWTNEMDDRGLWVDRKNALVDMKTWNSLFTLIRSIFWGGMEVVQAAFCISFCGHEGLGNKTNCSAVFRWTAVYLLK